MINEVRNSGANADLRSDELIREHLGSKFPQHRFLSEEVIVEDKFDFSGPVWIIDPIDGTANYAHGHPYVSISVVLTLDGALCVGVAHAPFLHETYAAILGAGATCNGHPVRVSEVSDLHRALIGTGFPHDRSEVTPAIERVRRLVTECLDIRRAGSPALDIAWVAAGRLDAHAESLATWDIAAAGLIATEAGAVSGNLWPGVSSLPPLLRGEGFIVATPGIFERLYELLVSE
jgi:myo-inositol-1(or 4)-monophosphatase